MNHAALHGHFDAVKFLHNIKSEDIEYNQYNDVECIHLALSHYSYGVKCIVRPDIARWLYENTNRELYDEEWLSSIDDMICYHENLRKN